MERTIFTSLLKEIENQINLNRKTIDKLIEVAMSKGEFIKIDKLIEILHSYKDIYAEVPEQQKIAVSYSGNPEITLVYMLDSILYNNRVVLSANKNKQITEMLFTIFNFSLGTLKIKNQWIDYASNYNEIFLRDNENKFERIIFIGDYLEYCNFKLFFKKEVEYNNYGCIKIFIDKKKYQEEYRKITKYAYEESISLEEYDDVEDFINECKEHDFAIIFADFQLMNTIQKTLKAEDVLFNTFPYDTYKFKIER